MPLAPFREAFKRSGLSAGEVAFRCGWCYGNKATGDGGRLLRRLGLKPETRRDGRYLLKATDRIHIDVATLLCEALDLDPCGVGL